MSDITKKTEDILKQIKDKSLSAKISDLKTKVMQAKNLSNNVILCDVSTSMDEIIENAQERKGPNYKVARAIDVVNAIVNDFEGAQIFQFSDHCSRVPSGTQMHTVGGTNLTGALQTMKAHNIKEFVLLTDGQPNHAASALQEAKGLTIKIIYIGPAPTPDFLLKLGHVGNNAIESVELLKAGAEAGKKAIEAKIKGFLGA